MTTNYPVAFFRDLHAQDAVLLLPNVWDAASTALFKAAGAKAIATTSAGLAWSCGFADGDELPRDVLLFALSAICRAAGETPVTADIEGGYSNDPHEVAALVSTLRKLGVVGINLEDGLGAPELLEEKIDAIKRTMHDDGADIFINARTDVFLHDLASGEAAVTESIARARRYAQAGADGIFVPLARDLEAIQAIARSTQRPLNVIALPDFPALRKLHALGVRRISAGPTLARLAFGAARNAAAAFLREGSLDALQPEASVEYGEMNALFSRD